MFIELFELGKESYNVNIIVYYISLTLQNLYN